MYSDGFSHTHLDPISMGLPIVYFRGHRINMFLKGAFLKFVLILVNSVDSDEMQHYAAFHLGLHRWPKGPLGVPIHKEVDFT